MEGQVGKMEAQLRELGLALNAIEAASAIAAPDDARRRTIVDLKVQHRRVEKKLNDLKMSSNHEWGKHKLGLEKAWSELDAAFRRLRK